MRQTKENGYCIMAPHGRDFGDWVCSYVGLLVVPATFGTFVGFESVDGVRAPPLDLLVYDRFDERR